MQYSNLIYTDTKKTPDKRNTSTNRETIENRATDARRIDTMFFGILRATLLLKQASTQRYTSAINQLAGCGIDRSYRHRGRWSKRKELRFGKNNNNDEKKTINDILPY